MNVEKMLQHCIQDALAEKHTAALVDPHANLITDNVPIAIECLFYDFG